MIVLKLDPKFKKRFPNLDMHTLSLVYSVLFDSIYNVKKKRNYNIYIKMTAGIDSYYKWQQGSNVRINLTDIIFDIGIFHKTLLHEFRHFIQDKVFKIPLTKKNYNDTTDKTYMLSPVEIDAEYFEIITFKKVIQIYNRLVKAKNHFSKTCRYKGRGL